jgi:hypothetical protein
MAEEEADYVGFDILDKDAAFAEKGLLRKRRINKWLQNLKSRSLVNTFYVPDEYCPVKMACAHFKFKDTKILMTEPHANKYDKVYYRLKCFSTFYNDRENQFYGRTAMSQEIELTPGKTASL